MNRRLSSRWSGVRSWSCAFALVLVVMACGSSRSTSKPGAQAGAAGHTGGGTEIRGGSSGGGKSNSNGGANPTGGSFSGSSGGSAGTSSAGVSGEVVDLRPPAPAWNPGFALGDPGWRQSGEPFCEHHQGPLAGFEIWADARGVFAVALHDCQFVGRDLPYCPAENRERAGTTLEFNDGTGWRTLGGSQGLFEITGLPGGPVLVNGSYAQEICRSSGSEVTESACALSLVDLDAAPVCSLLIEQAREPCQLSHRFGVNAELAFAVNLLDLLEYSNGTWNKVQTLPELPTALWANEELVVIATEFQVLSWKRGSEVSVRPLPEVPVGSYTALWGFSATDLWFGNSFGQLVHFDGTGYQISMPSAGHSGSILRLWGENGVLYYLSSNEFGRVVSGKRESLLSLPGVENSASASFRSLWGTSEKDVFITLEEPEFQGFACGGEFTLWFDGAEFHRF